MLIEDAASTIMQKVTFNNQQNSNMVWSDIKGPEMKIQVRQFKINFILKSIYKIFVDIQKGIYIYQNQY